MRLYETLDGRKQISGLDGEELELLGKLSQDIAKKADELQQERNKELTTTGDVDTKAKALREAIHDASRRLNEFEEQRARKNAEA